MSEITVRAPRRSDAAALARIWIENCRYYADMDSDSFQVPKEDGLVEWFEDYLEKPTEESELRLVAELDGEVVGDLVAKIL